MRCVSSNCKIPVIPHPNNEKFLALFSQEICGEHRRFGGPVGAENLPAGHQGLPGPRRRRVGEQEEASASVLCTLTMNFGLSRLCFSHFSRRHDKSSRQWRLTIAQCALHNQSVYSALVQCHAVSVSITCTAPVNCWGYTIRYNNDISLIDRDGMHCGACSTFRSGMFSGRVVSSQGSPSLFRGLYYLTRKGVMDPHHLRSNPALCFQYIGSLLG